MQSKLRVVSLVNPSKRLESDSHHVLTNQ